MQEIRVLLIAEDEDFCEILTDRLRSWGFAAVAAGNAEEAMDAIFQTRPDVVVLSLRAVHGHDLDTLRLIKAIDSTIEVILLTCRGTTITGMKGVEQGALDCLQQPIDLGVLIQKIHVAFARRNLPNNLASTPLFLPLAVVDGWPDVAAALFSLLYTPLKGLLLL